MKVKLTADELLDSVSEHTGTLRKAVWLRHIRYNEKTYGFNRTISDLRDSYKGEKVVVIGAGPGFKRFGTDDLHLIRNEKLKTGRPIVIACDGALSTLSGVELVPDYVNTVDAHPVVANFFRRNLDLLKRVQGVFLATSIHRDVVEAVGEAGVLKYWWQPWFKPNSKAHFSTGFYRDGVTSINTGGNVGTTSYIIAAEILRCRPIGLMGLEFAWSDETPLADTQYFTHLMKAVNDDPVVAREHYLTVKNPRDGKTYMADPVYYSYFTALRGMWRYGLSRDIKKNTYLLTKQGIINLRGLKYVEVDEFLK